MTCVRKFSAWRPHEEDLAAAFAFYRDVVGFNEHAFMGPFGTADLRAGGAFPHRIALNNWHGPGARQPVGGTAGMRHFGLVLHELGADEDLAVRAGIAGRPTRRDVDGALALTDPAGNRIVVSVAVLPSEA